MRERPVKTERTAGGRKVYDEYADGTRDYGHITPRPNGKGSARRPGNRQAYAAGWERVFGKGKRKGGAK